MPDTQPSPETVAEVGALLTAAGLTVPSDEIAMIAASYTDLRAAASRLDALVYDDDPMPVFDPVPFFSAGRHD